MKKVTRLFISVIVSVMMLSVMTAALASGQIPELTFTAEYFHSGQTFRVYSAPSVSSWRGAKGKAAVSTNHVIWCAGMEDLWLLVMYETHQGGMQVGYVDTRTIQDVVSPYGQLGFRKYSIGLVQDCILTDDPEKHDSEITTLEKGSQVLLLAFYRDDAYVEAEYNMQTVRGFIPKSALDAEEEKCGMH